MLRICPRQIQILSFSYLIFRTLGEVSYSRYINLKIFFYHNWLWSKQLLLNLTLLRKMRRKGRNASLWNSKGPLSVKNATRGLRKKNTWESTSLKYILTKRGVESSNWLMLLEETFLRFCTMLLAFFPSSINRKQICYIWTKNERWTSRIGKNNKKSAWSEIAIFKSIIIQCNTWKSIPKQEIKEKLGSLVASGYQKAIRE